MSSKKSLHVSYKITTLNQIEKDNFLFFFIIGPNETVPDICQSQFLFPLTFAFARLKHNRGPPESAWNHIYNSHCNTVKPEYA